MLYARFIAIVTLLPIVLATSDQFWVTTVLIELKIREQCADFWNQSQACPSPLLRIATDVNQPNQFASRAWPIKDIVNSAEKISFISQWHGSISSVRASAQIEGSNPLNPFGLVAKCDQGYHPKVIFNRSSTEIMERLSTRVVVIKSECFTVKLLVQIDNECPYCPPSTTAHAPISTVSERYHLFTNKVLIGACIAFASLGSFSTIVFCIILVRFRKLRRGRYLSLESGISTITPLTHSTIVSTSDEKLILPKFANFFSLEPPEIDCNGLEESIQVEPMPLIDTFIYDLLMNKNDCIVSDPVYV